MCASQSHAPEEQVIEPNKEMQGKIEHFPNEDKFNLSEEMQCHSTDNVSGWLLYLWKVFLFSTFMKL